MKNLIYVLVCILCIIVILYISKDLFLDSNSINSTLLSENNTPSESALDEIATDSELKNSPTDSIISVNSSEQTIKTHVVEVKEKAELVNIKDNTLSSQDRVVTDSDIQEQEPAIKEISPVVNQNKTVSTCIEYSEKCFEQNLITCTKYQPETFSYKDGSSSYKYNWQISGTLESCDTVSSRVIDIPNKYMELVVSCNQNIAKISNAGYSFDIDAYTQLPTGGIHDSMIQEYLLDKVSKKEITDYFTQFIINETKSSNSNLSCKTEWKIK